MSLEIPPPHIERTGSTDAAQLSSLEEQLDRVAERIKEKEAEQEATRVALAVAAERAVCAEIVRAAGCFCARSKEAEPDGWIEGLDPVEYEPSEIPEPLRVKVHHPRCPQALAAAIEARK